MKALARVNGLTVRYGSVVAVDNVSFEVNAGEIVAVIGPNGSGKTSLVECLEGLRRQADGTVRVFDKCPHADRKKVYSSLGIQLQDIHYPNKIKVGELCALFSSFYESPLNWKILLKELGLEEKQKRYVNKLSGGEKQRLSILLALLPKPKLLILDELTTGLDPEARRNIWDSLKVSKDSGAGVLLVSHYMDEVAALADRIIFMIQGKAIYIGTLEGFREFAKYNLPKAVWKPELSLEDIYILLLPPKNQRSLEGLQ